jgi:putative transposase
MHDLSIPLPSQWPRYVRSGVLHAVSLAHKALTYSRSWAADSSLQRIRLKGRLDRATEEISILDETARIKDQRMRRIPPHSRPHYSPPERMAILELRASRGWSAAQTARVFLVEPETISSWTRRLDEDGPHALVRLPEVVSRFPDFVGYLARRLKTLCPRLGKKRIAEILARAGLHLGVTTVRRMLALKSQKEKALRLKAKKNSHEQESIRVVSADYPDHLWHIDLTIVPTGAGFWVPWIPFSWLQVWPFCWWACFIIDHFSRNVVGFALFASQPSSVQVRTVLGRAISRTGTAPRYLVSDKGCQFFCRGFKRWCRRRKIKPRFGAVGRYGSISVIERFIGTFKNECSRRILVPLGLGKMRQEAALYVTWHNEHRPHQALGGKTPNEVFRGLEPANERPRLEPRKRWPKKSRCASPQAPVRGNPGVRFELRLSFLGGRKHLPIVELKRAA